MYHHHFLQHTSDSSGFWGAFLGAFFAFVFGLITYWITKRRERFVQHKNAVVKLERVLNKHLDDFGSMTTIIKGMNENLGLGKVDISRLFKIELPDNLDVDLGSIDLINKFLVYQISIGRLNFNISSVNHALTRIEDMFINNHPIEPENFNFIRRMLGGLLKDLPRIDNRTLEFLAVVRIHNKRLKHRNTFIYGTLNDLWDQDISEDEIKTEIAKLDQELKEAMKKGSYPF